MQVHSQLRGRDFRSAAFPRIGGSPVETTSQVLMCNIFQVLAKAGRGALRCGDRTHDFH